MGQIHVDEMSVYILCTDLRDFSAKSVGAVSKNLFCKNTFSLKVYSVIMNVAGGHNCHSMEMFSFL